MSSSYLLLKENKQEAILSKSASNNQTILIEDANASSSPSTFVSLEWNMSTFLILTLILFSINVLFKLIEKLLDYLRERFHAHHSQKKNSESSKDPQ